MTPTKNDPTKAGKKAPSTASGAKNRPESHSGDSDVIRHTPTPGLFGWITHTDLASEDPAATRKWCADVLGWVFRAPIPTAEGDLHLFAYSDKGGGAIRRTNPPETPGALPYVHVADTDDAFERAVAAGAESMMPPQTVMEGVRIAIVRAPGGIPIGFSGPSEPGHRRLR